MTDAGTAAAASPLRVVLGDGRTLFRETLARLLAAQPGLEVVALSATTADLLQAAATLAPDVVMIEPGLPGDAFAAIETLRARHPRTEVLLYGLPEDDVTFIGALRAGVKGFADLEADLEYLASSIRRVAAGEVAVSPRLARHIAAWTAPLAEPALLRRPESDLTDRELDVLRLIAAGHSNRETAEALRLSEHTVRAHLRAVARKLGARNRVQAVSEAIRLGLVHDSPLSGAAARSGGAGAVERPRGSGGRRRGVRR